MKLTRLIPALLLGAATVAACGGPSTSPAASDLAASSPSLDEVGLSVADSDPSATPELPPSGTNQAGPTTAPGSTDATAEACHPHLFVRSHEVVERVNRHFRKALHHVSELIEDHPKALNAGTATWENVSNNVDRLFTITKSVAADGSVTYAYSLKLSQVNPATAAVVVMSGSTVRAAVPAGAKVSPHVTGNISFDFDALHSVVASEKATGKIAETFDRTNDTSTGKNIKHLATVTMDKFLPDEGNVHGPISGNYIALNEPGVGGSLEFKDSAILLCTGNAAAPTASASDIVAVARWYLATDGKVHGRSDAKASGGALAAGDVWMGATCAVEQPRAGATEGLWLMKEENASGATVGTAYSNSFGATPCDAVFGAVPSLTSNASDFAFPADFTAPFPFPNMK